MIQIAPGNGFLGGVVDIHNHTISLRESDGRLVKMDLGTADVHVDAAMQNYITGYKPADMIADAVSPPVVVNKTSNYFFQFDPDNALAVTDGTQTAPGADPPMINPKLSTTRYSTLGYSLGGILPTEVISNQDAPLNLQMATLRMIMDRLALNREARVKTIAYSSSNFTGTHLLDLSGVAATRKWNGGSAATPVRDIKSLMEASLMPITDMAMSLDTWNAFTENANVQGFVAFKSGSPPLPGTTQAELFCALLKLPRVHISEVRAKNVTAGTYPYVWANDVILFRAPATQVTDVDISTFKTFRWNGAGDNSPLNDSISGGGPAMNGWTVRSFFNPYKGGRGVHVVLVTHNDAEMLIDQRVGGYIKGATA